MSSAVSSSSLSFTIREYKTEIAEALLAVVGVVATIIFACRAVGERYVIGSDWKDGSYAFHTYTEIGGVYVALSVASAVMATAMVIRILIGSTAEEIRRGRQISNDPTNKKGFELYAKLALMIITYGAFLACVYLAVKAEHTRHMTTVDKFHNGEITDDTALSAAGDGMEVGAVGSGLLAVAAATTSCFIYYINRQEKASITKARVDVLRGNVADQNRAECMDEIEAILFSDDGYTRNVDLRQHIIEGNISEKEVAFLDKIFHPYHRIKKALAALREEVSDLSPEAGVTRPSPQLKARRKHIEALNARINHLEDCLAAVKREWVANEEAVFNEEVPAPKPAPTIVSGMPPIPSAPVAPRVTAVVAVPVSDA